MATELPSNSIGILAGLTREQKNTFHRFFIQDGKNNIDCPSNQQITRKGESSNNLFLILFGSVNVTVVRHQITLEKGSCFGEINFYTEGGRTADVVSGPNGAILIKISRQQFNLYAINHPNAAQKIIKNITSLIAERFAGIIKIHHEVQDRLTSTQQTDIYLIIKALISNLSQALTQHTIPLLHGLSEEEIYRFTVHFPIKKFAPNEIMIRQGDHSKDLLYIISDTAVIEGTARLGVTQTIGDIAFVADIPRTADVFAGSHGATIHVITPASFQKFATDLPATAGRIRTNLLIILTTKLRATIEAIEKYYEEARKIEKKEEPRTLTERLIRTLTQPISLKRR